MILLVEDSKWEGDEMKRLLERQGYGVRWVADGEAALAEVRRKVPELVVLDVGLPGMTGVDVLFALRRGPEFEGTAARALPVIVVSGSADRVKYFEARYLGAAAWFLKVVFEPQDFVKAVKECLKTGKATAQAAGV
jgi:DNA-binding response OmpR family regulator